MKRKTTIVFFMLLMLWSISNVLLAQNNVILTPKEIIDIQNSKEYFFGEGWDEIKDQAIDLALTELKNKLKNKEVKNYKITKLETYEGYYFMVFIEKNAPIIDVENVAEEPLVEVVNIIQEPLVDYEITKHIEKLETGIEQVILDLKHASNLEGFMSKFQRYNRQNLLWGSTEKEKMPLPAQCYVAVFNKNGEMELFLDRGSSSRNNLLTGETIQNFETNYSNGDYKIIWIELIEKQ